MMRQDNDEHWYAAYTRVNQEMSIKERLDALAIENYLPIRETIKIGPEGRKKIRELLVRGLIFIRTDRVTSFTLLNDYALNVIYIPDRETRRSLIIPDKQMKDFMFLLDFSDEVIEVVNKELRRGDRVRVIKGPFVGLEGELVRVKGHKRVVIRLDGLVSIATSYIPGSYLEKIN